MLDIRFVRENSQAVKDDLTRRGDLEKIEWVDELLRLDVEWRRMMTEVNRLREQRNRITEEIARLKKSGQEASERIREAEAIPDKIVEQEKTIAEHRQRIDFLLMRLPNLMHESVPQGKDEQDNVEVKVWGNKPSFSFKPKDHIDLGEGLKLIDIERAAKVAGARFYYLRNDLVRLNWAIVSFALDRMNEKKFTLIQPPYLLRREAMEGAVDLSDFQDVIYKVENEDLHLIATSEHALLGMHKDEILNGEDLPLRYCGVSPCFRKEAGAHGRDTKGIFRVHQFEKVEQFIFSKPEQSWAEHELMIRNAEEIFQTLKLPYRIVNVCSGELGTVASKKFDLEVWLPGQNKYREAVSCSNCTSYQAVRSNIKYRDKPNEPTAYVHTLNSTLIATERALVAILENCQREDGSITIPDALVSYMNGTTEISTVRK